MTDDDDIEGAVRGLVLRDAHMHGVGGEGGAWQRHLADDEAIQREVRANSRKTSRLELRWARLAGAAVVLGGLTGIIAAGIGIAIEHFLGG